MKRNILLFLSLQIATIAVAQTNKVKLETEYGNIVIMLYDNTPLNTANMLKVARDHGYDSTLFHRVIPTFMIQGGDPDSKHAAPGQMLGNGGLKYTVPAEINDSDYHKRGALGVARDNNPQKAGSASQFYIVVGKVYTDAELDMIESRTGHKFTASQRQAYKTTGGAPHLDGNYTVFGEVIEGMDIADKIAAAPRDRNDRPSKDIRILKLSVIEDTPMKKKRKHHFLFF